MKSVFFLSLLFSTLLVNAAQISTVEAKPECYDVFYGKKDRIYLTGKWSYKKVLCKHKDYFKIAKENINLAEKSVNTKSWNNILVPNYMDVHSRKPQDSAATFLRRDFNISDFKKDKRYILKFQGIAWEPIIYINGKKVAELKNILPGFPMEFFQNDITEYLKKGTNNITVSIFVSNRSGRIISCGIYAPVMIDVVNPVYLREMLIHSQLPDMAKVKCTIENSTGKTVKSEITAEVSPWKNTGTTTVLKLGKRLLKAGKNKLEFTVKINNPILWNLANPFLYSLKLKVGDKLAGFERFGLREFKSRDGNFYLNGNKINCYGIAAAEGNLARLMYVESYSPQFINNTRGVLRKYIKMLKANNCSTAMRWPSFSRAMNDICDEEGFINFHMILPWKHTKDMPLWIKRKIVAKGRKIPEKLSHGYFYEKVNGKFERCGKDIFDIEGRNSYLNLVYNKLGKLICNSPSVVAILNGDENFRSCNQAFDMPLMRKSLYETCPGMVFAGEHGIGSTSMTLDGKRIPVVPDQDLVNYAGANCGGASMNVCHFSMYPFTLKWRYELYNKNIYPKPLPNFADESLYYGVIRTSKAKRLWRFTLKSYSSMYPKGKVDIEQMIKILGNPAIDKANVISNRYKRTAYIRKETKGTWWPYRKHIKLMGLQVDGLDQRVLFGAIAKRVKKMGEMVRMYDQYMQGVGAVTGPWFNYDMDKMLNLDPAGIKSTSPIGEMFKLVYSPLFTCLSLYDNQHSFIAGDKLDTKIFAFNNSGFDSKDVKVELILSQSNKRVFNKTVNFNTLKAGSKVVKEISIPFAAGLKTGDCTITLKMRSANKELLTNSYNVFVLSQADAHPQLSFKDTLYVLNGKNRIMNKKLTELLGNIKGIKIEYIENLAKLDKIKYLLIAPRALNKSNEKELAKLNPWLKKGGRMLALEQSYIGSFPWLPGVKNVPLVGKFAKYFTLFGIDLMPVHTDYPAFDKIEKRHYWNTLNNKYGEVYRTLMAPLDKDAMAIGADVGFDEFARCFGALLIEKKVGSGTCIMSQVEAVKASGKKDGVAAKYLYNLIKHITNK